jgi:hypothetical protein
MSTLNNLSLPADVFALKDTTWYDFIHNRLGINQAEWLKFLFINDAFTYITCGDPLKFLQLDAPSLLHVPFKEKLCLKKRDESYVVFPGITGSFTGLTQLLTRKETEHAKAIRNRRSSLLIASSLSTNGTVNHGQLAVPITNATVSQLPSSSTSATPFHHQDYIAKAIQVRSEKMEIFWVLSNSNWSAESTLLLISMFPTILASSNASVVRNR